MTFILEEGTRVIYIFGPFDLCPKIAEYAFQKDFKLLMGNAVDDRSPAKTYLEKLAAGRAGYVETTSRNYDDLLKADFVHYKNRLEKINDLLNDPDATNI